MHDISKYHGLFLGAGAFFPLISLITGLLSAYEWNVNKRHCSPVFIPFFGPILFDIGLLLAKEPLWTLLLPWVLDIGTIAFLFAIPGMTRDWWQTSRFTLINNLAGKQNNQTATITLHRTGKYLLRKQWQRPAGEFGVVSLGELGHYVMGETEIQLHSDNGWSRTLKRGANNQFIVEETDNAHADYSLQGWTLQLV